MATTSGATSSRWIHYAMLNAEELGVTKANVDEMLKSENPDIKRLLGIEGEFGKQLGLTTTGPTASSSTSATTARSSSATSAPARRSRSSAA